MELAPVLFGIGCAVSYWLAVRSRDTGARTIAGYLTAAWALANAMWLADALWLMPALDLGLGLVALHIWWLTGARRVALIVNAVAMRLILHVLDALTGHVFLVSYLHALNATFVWMLVVVASSGGGHVRNYLLRRVRRIRSALSPSPERGLNGGR